MSQVNNILITNLLYDHFKSYIRSVEESYGMLDIVVERGTIIEIVKWLRDDNILKFNFLTSLCGVHFPEKTNEELEVVYHLHSFTNNIRIRLHVFLPQNDANISTITHIFSGANWMERETYEFYGIVFVGHPDLRIILNVEDMEYFPLLKQYPLNDDTRTDKDDKYFGR